MGHFNELCNNLGSGRDPPDLLELNMSEESESAAAAPKYYDSVKDENAIEDEEMEEEFVETENGIEIKQEPSDPMPGTSQGNLLQQFFFTEMYIIFFNKNIYITDLSTLKKDHDSQSNMQLDQSACGK